MHTPHCCTLWLQVHHRLFTCATMRETQPTGLVSQSDIVRFLWDHRTELGSLKEQRIEDLGLCAVCSWRGAACVPSALMRMAAYLCGPASGLLCFQRQPAAASRTVVYIYQLVLPFNAQRMRLEPVRFRLRCAAECIITCLLNTGSSGDGCRHRDGAVRPRRHVARPPHLHGHHRRGRQPGRHDQHQRPAGAAAAALQALGRAGGGAGARGARPRRARGVQRCAAVFGAARVVVACTRSACFSCLLHARSGKCVVEDSFLP